MRINLPKPNIVDKIVGFFNPSAGLERLRGRIGMDSWQSGNSRSGISGYEGGDKGRRSTRNWSAREQQSANAEVRYTIDTLRARTRDLARNAPIAAGAIQTNITNVVADGLKANPSINRSALGIDPEDDASNVIIDDLEEQIAQEWQIAANSIDLTCSQNFSELQGLAFRSVLESGDLLVIRRYRKDAGDIYGLKLQFVEADRVNNPNRQPDKVDMLQGAQLNSDGVATGYAVCSKYLFEYVIGMPELAWKIVPTKDNEGNILSFLLRDKLRPEMVRGVPYLSVVIEPLKVLTGYAEAELKAALVNAMFTVFVKSERSEGDPPIVGSNVNGSGKNDEISLGTGAVVGLAEGEDVTFADPKRPSTAFDPFVTAILRQVGVALDLPFEILIKHFASSYSASRGALEMAWQAWRVRRKWLATNFCQQVYCWFMDEAVASGRLYLPGYFEDAKLRAAYQNCEWRGQAQISLNPTDDAKADTLDLALMVKSRSQIIQSRTGGNWKRVIGQLSKEDKDIKAAGLQVIPPPVSSTAAQQDVENGNSADPAKKP